MKLSQIISKDTIVYDLKSADKKGAIRELVAQLKEAGRITADQEEKVYKEVMKREALGTTGIGNHGAVPHAKVENLKEMIGAFGRSSGGINFNSLDNEDVHAVFLVISPASEVQNHLKALKKISELIKHEHFCRFVRESGSFDVLKDLLEEFDTVEV